MRTNKATHFLERLGNVRAFRIIRMLLRTGALFLICSVPSLFAQVDVGQFIRRNSSISPTVSRNQLIAPARAARAMERAQRDIFGGHLAQAQKDITRALDIAPHFAVAKVLRGALELETRDFEAARSLFQQAIDDDPALGAAYVGMAVVMIHDGRSRAALPLLDRAEGLLPGAWFVHYAKAWSELEIGDTEAALKQANFAERIAGTDHEKRSGLSYLRGMVALNRNDLAAAREHLSEAVTRDRGGPYSALANRQMERLQPVVALAR